MVRYKMEGIKQVLRILQGNPTHSNSPYVNIESCKTSKTSKDFIIFKSKCLFFKPKLAKCTCKSNKGKRYHYQMLADCRPEACPFSNYFKVTKQKRKV